jgi:hypothetical protein
LAFDSERINRNLHSEWELSMHEWNLHSEWDFSKREWEIFIHGTLDSGTLWPPLGWLKWTVL